MHKQLIITGFHRSGTSMLAQELHNAGLFLGDRLMKPDISNADGHYEDMDFFTFHEKILRSHHLNWQYASDESIDIPQLYKPDMHRIIQDRSPDCMVNPYGVFLLHCWEVLPGVIIIEQ